MAQFVGLGSWLQKLDMHYLHAADVGRAGQGLEFQIQMPVC